MFRIEHVTFLFCLLISLGNTTRLNAQIISGHSAYLDIRNITAPDSTYGPACKEVNGLLNGTCRTFWPDGRIKSEGFYKNDSICGKYKVWYSDGTLREEWSLSPDNRNGLSILYWQNGNKEIQIFFENGSIAEQKHWNENGAFMLHEIMLDSGVVSITAYSNNGLIEHSGTLYNGERSGLWRFYNELGELCGIKAYENGNIVNEKKRCP